MGSHVKISIIIPTMNRKESLEKTLISLGKQSYSKSDYEIIICDDVKSHDGTDKFIQDFIASHDLNIKYFKIKTDFPGPAAARNYGVNQASGKIIGFIDDDCMAFPDWICTAMKTFDNQNIDIIQGSVLPMYPDFKWSNLFKIPRGVIHTQDNGFYVTANMFLKKEAFEESNGFEERLKWGEDTDLVYRLLKTNRRIIFSEAIRVYHEMEYLDLISYCKYLRNYSYLPLQIKRNPEIREHLFMRIFSTKYHIYPLMAFFSVISFLAGFKSVSNLLLLVSIFFYIYSRVFTDFKIHKHLLRILFFPRNLVIDSVRLYYVVKGSIKYKILLI
jgi:glycosyltransferase involved in cell wall biosynthesis